MNIPQRAVAVGVGAALLQALMLIAFAWPAVHTTPRDLPVAVAGPGAAQMVERLGQSSPGVLEPRTVGDEAAARTALTEHEVYGAILTGPQPRVLVASGASPLVAQQLTQLAQQLSGAPAATAVEDVVPADPDDPRGAGFGAMALPLVMSGIAAGVLLSLLVPTAVGRFAGVFTFAVAGGLLSMVIVQGWLSILPGEYLMLAGVAGLVSLAVAGAVAGLATAIGRAGIGIAALTMLLVGNPFSAATSAPELLPQPWSAIGQALPPGAAVSLLRSVAFFDGAGAGGPLLVLLIWAGAALALFGVGVVRERGAAEPAPERAVPQPA